MDTTKLFNTTPLVNIEKKTIQPASLSQDYIDIWYFDHSQLPLHVLQTRFEHWMNQEEKERFNKFVFEKDKKSFLATRCLIRAVLSFYFQDISPAAWRFINNAYGKPFIDTSLHKPVFFNLSNSKHLAVCAIGLLNEKLGIDTESMSRFVEMEGIAELCLSEKEKTHLHELPAAEQQKQLLLYWTIKEAYIKAQGLGLSLPLDEITIEEKQAAISIFHHKMGNGHPLNWHTHCYELASQHIIAICSYQEHPQLHRAFAAGSFLFPGIT